MPAGVGYEPTPCRIASQAFTAPRPEIARPLSHGGRLYRLQGMLRNDTNSLMQLGDPLT